MAHREKYTSMQFLMVIYLYTIFKKVYKMKMKYKKITQQKNYTAKIAKENHKYLIKK